jgi:hypothetical protein
MSKAIDFQQPTNFPYSTTPSQDESLALNGSSAHKENKKNCFGLAHWFQQSTAGRWLELISAVLSFGCLVVLLCQWGSGGPATVRLTQEVLLYTNEVSLTNAMHHLNFEYERWCDSDFRMNLEVPTWDPENVDRHPLDVTPFHNPKKKKKDLVLQGISTSIDIHYTTIDLFFIAVSIFVFSCLFQFARYRFYSTEANPNGWYKPSLGPEFSRWTEYLCTAPLQIFLVCVAFGTTNISTLLGQVGMQAALVLFGYDIEQQIKKIYKRALKQNKQDTKRFHNIFGVVNLRLYVYLGVSWLLHALIWSVILGRFYLQERQGELCEKQKDFRMPPAVTFIVWSQFGSFTCFGVVCTWQAISAAIWGKNMSKDKQSKAWKRVSFVYAFLSITAKTFLEVGFVWVVSIYKPFELASPANIQSGFMVNSTNQTCFSIVHEAVSIQHG